jgi:hypothetical protein
MIALDAEAAVVSFLTEHLTMPVSTELPADAELPRLRITRAGGLSDEFAWIDRPNIFVEAWASTKAEARELAAQALAALLTDLPGALFPDGAVTHVQPDTGLSWAPDPDLQTARYLFSVTLVTHPNQ